jgi:fatty-acyl-CoA synthase
VAANPFAEATAYEMLAAIAQRHGARPAIVFGGERITFADLRARADALASGLAALGLRHGDALAIWLPNRPLWFVAQYAAARLGLVVVALNPRCRARELTYISPNPTPPPSCSPTTSARSTTSKPSTR